MPIVSERDAIHIEKQIDEERKQTLAESGASTQAIIIVNTMLKNLKLVPGLIDKGTEGNTDDMDSAIFVLEESVGLIGNALMRLANEMPGDWPHKRTPQSVLKFAKAAKAIKM